MLLEERGQEPKVGRVDQIAQVVKLSTSAAGHSVIRMWCTQCRIIYIGNLRYEQCVCFSALISEPSVSMLVRYECMSVTRARCDIGGCVMFR